MHTEDIVFPAYSLAEQVAVLRSIRHELALYKSEINAAWKAQETLYYNKAIDELDARLRRLCTNIEDICEDIIHADTETREKGMEPVFHV